MKKGGTSAAPKTNWKQFFRFLRQIKLDWPMILVAMAVGIVYYEITARIPGSTGALMSGDFSRAAIVSMVTYYACQLLLSGLRDLIDTFATGRSTRSARNMLWGHMMGVSAEFYHDNTPEELLSAVTTDIESAVSSLVSLAASTIPNIYFVFRSFTIVRGYHWKLLLTLFVMVPVNILYAIYVGKWQYNTNHRILARIAALTSYLSERLKNLGLIKSYANEAAEDVNGQRTIKELYHAKKQTTYLNSLYTGYLMGSQVISTVTAVLIASLLIRSGELDLAGWMTFYLFVPRISSGLRQLSTTWITIKGLLGHSVRLGRIIDAPKEVQEKGAAVSNGDIAFQNVSFAYGEETVLDHVSFTAPAGSVTAIVGLSGSGKSTMLSLLERLYIPKSGVITMNGTNISKMDLVDFRRRFAYVQQDAGVFSGSFREVLTYGVERNISDNELIQATKLAGIYDYIMAQPGGFDAKVAIWGGSLSGGQRQRLVIARETLKDADVLLFDEPTSALDAATARDIQETIRRTFQGKTILMVSHDLSLMGSADQVVVVDQGRVQNVGGHNELLERCPLYRELVDEQAYQEVFAQ